MSETLTNVPIINNKIRHLKSFETPEEFNRYYAKHKADIDAKTTNQLNREYTIKGHKITKRNMKIVNDPNDPNFGKRIGDLFLKALEVTASTNDVQSEESHLQEQIDDLYAKITQLNELYKQLATVVNSIIA